MPSSSRSDWVAFKLECPDPLSIPSGPNPGFMPALRGGGLTWWPPEDVDGDVVEFRSNN